MQVFYFKDLINDFKKSNQLDFFSLIDKLWEEKWIKSFYRNKDYLKDWIKFLYFLGKIKKITNISKIDGLLPHLFDINYLKFFFNYSLVSILSIEPVFIEYFNPWGLDKEKHKKFIVSFLDTIDKLLNLVVISNNYNLFNLKKYTFVIDSSHIKNAFVPYGLSLKIKKRKIQYYLGISILVFVISILLFLLSYQLTISVNILTYKINIAFLLGVIFLFLFVKIFFSLLNWYYNLSKLIDLYEYFSLMLDLSELELIGVKKEENQIELKKIIMNNITRLLGNVDSIYNKSLLTTFFKKPD